MVSLQHSTTARLMNNMSEPKEHQEIDYSFPKIGTFKFVLLCLFLILFFTISTFPISKTIDGLIQQSLNAVPNCNIHYKDYKFELFMPKVVFSNLNFPSSCFGNSGESIELKKVNLLFRGLSFAPFGPSFKVETEFLKNPINAYIAAGIGEVALNFSNNTIKLSSFQSFMPQLQIDGNLTYNLLVKSNYNDLSDLKVVIQSKDIQIPSQKIMGLNIPNSSINNFYLKADFDKSKKLKLKDLIIGDTKASIRANFKGDLRPNFRSFSSSFLSLKGEVAFEKDFLEKVPVGIFMSSFNKKDEFYQINLEGPLNNIKKR